MHTISHLIEPSRLLLVWQDPKGESRTRFVVGELRRSEDGGATFAYRTETPDFIKAQALGFQGYPAFRKSSQVYRDGVLEAFLQRLPPRKRADFGKYLETLRLPQNEHLSDFMLLGYSGAKLPGDGFSLVHPFENVDRECELLLEVAGFRYQNVPVRELRIGDAVSFAFEPNNVVDPNAVKIMVGGRRIGYVNRVQTPAFSHWLRTKSVTAHIERLNGRPERPLVYLFVEVRQVHPLLVAAG
ncbi:MAG TPA: HIRAN domain-containing protein [Gammaproteobacteria bacterium]|nr:HIRAN domain-containing protein [Gammaproteobacteria bacterium]